MTALVAVLAWVSARLKQLKKVKINTSLPTSAPIAEAVRKYVLLKQFHPETKTYIAGTSVPAVYQSVCVVCMR